MKIRRCWVSTYTVAETLGVAFVIRRVAAAKASRAPRRIVIALVFGFWRAGLSSASCSPRVHCRWRSASPSTKRQRDV